MTSGLAIGVVLRIHGLPITDTEEVVFGFIIGTVSSSRLYDFWRLVRSGALDPEVLDGM